MTMQAPYTIYCAAMVWFHHDGTRHILSSYPFVVSGIEPLTREEVITRLRDKALAHWSAEYGPVTDWQERTTSVQTITVTLED